MAGRGKAGRRSNGEGSIYEDAARNRWIGQITIDGKRHSIYGDSREKVRLQLTAMARDRDRGLPVAEGNITVARWLDEWLESKRPLKDSSWMRYEQLIRLHIKPALGRVKLAKLTPRQVQQCYAAKNDGTRSISTVKRIHEVLHNALNDAMHNGLVGRNAADVANKPQNAKRTMSIYDTRQVGRLLRSIGDDRLSALVVLVVNTGMREGELIALKWADVDLQCGTVTIQQNRTRKLTGFADETTKTESSRRAIPLTPEALVALKAHRARQNAERLAMGDVWPRNDLVFISSAGTHLNASNLLKWWRKQTQAARLPYIRFHDLRHTAASWLFSKGASVGTVQNILGHADPATTLRVYRHEIRGDKENAMRLMSQMMQEAMEETTDDTETEAQ